MLDRENGKKVQGFSNNDFFFFEKMIPKSNYLNTRAEDIFGKNQIQD